MVYTLGFFSCSKCSLFHNSNIFHSCIIHILYTVCAKIKKNNSSAKRLSIAFCIIVRNFQVVVHFTLESHDKAQFNWNFCPCLQDVHQNYFPFQDFVSVYILIEENRIEYKKTGDSDDTCTLNILPPPPQSLYSCI